MSQQQHVLSYHCHIILIALTLVAGANGAAFAQTDQPPGATAPSAPAPAQPAKPPSPASAAIDAATVPKKAAEGIPAMVVDGEHVQGILGKPVRSSAGEDMGRIVDVLVERSGRVRAAVIDFGGFLGVGNRQIAVAWSAIRFPAEGKVDPLVVDFTRDQLRVAPAYKAGEQIVLLGNPAAPVNTGSAPEKETAPKDSSAQ